MLVQRMKASSSSTSSTTILMLPWLTTVAIIWLQSISATNTMFAAYSTQLKSNLSITQLQLNNLAVASDAGKLLGWFSGVVANHLPLQAVLMIGVTIGSIGYGVQFLYLANKITSLDYWHVFLLNLLAGNSICWINTVCYLGALRNFPVLDYGTIVTLTTSYSGLSAKIYIAMAQVILGRNPNDKSIYLLQNSIAPIIVSLLVIAFINNNITNVKLFGAKTRIGFVIIFALAMVTGSYAAVQSTFPAINNMAPRIAPLLLLLMVMAIVLLPLVENTKFYHSYFNKDNETRIINRTTSVIVAVNDDHVPDQDHEEENKSATITIAIDDKHEMEVSEYGALKLLKSVDFWLYFVVYLCGGTLGMVYANNLGQIAESRLVPATTLVSISSTFGFFGKLFSAPLSAFTRCKYMVSRPASLPLLILPMAISFFMLVINSTKSSLMIGTAIIGLCTGAITSIAIPITSDLFGAKHFGVNHNILVANIPLGSFLFGYIAGHIYEGVSEEVGACIGVQCYHMTFIIWGLFCSFGTIVSFVLYFRTRRHAVKS